jgi:hypothetical protein
MMWSGEREQKWCRKFALIPTEVERGQKVVWLGYYWKRYIPGDLLCEKCQIEVSERVIGHWETSAINPIESKEGSDG